MPETIDINPLLEGAILLALDELVNGHSMVAMNVLISARTTMVLYERAKAQASVETLRRVVMAIEGEFP